MRLHRRRFLRDSGLAALGAACASGGAGARAEQAPAYPIGVALAIGLNQLDEELYPGAPPLRGCVNDARAVHAIARSRGFAGPAPLIDDQATARNVIRGIRAACQKLQAAAERLAEDLRAGRDVPPERRHAGVFLIHYSGHGGSIVDTNGDEEDGKDETWCLYDRMLIDDELGELWAEFPESARVVIISDSCHSGTVSRGKAYESGLNAGDVGAKVGARGEALPPPKPDDLRFRALSDEVVQAHLERNAATYQGVLKDLPKYAPGADEGSRIAAAVMLLAGCQDNQYAGDLPENGLFTGRLLAAWGDGRFRGSYRSLYQTILAQMPSVQSPNLDFVGRSDPALARQAPFSI